MIIPDTNLLLYVYDIDSPFHDQAATWWQNCLTGSDPVGLPLVVVFGFVRIATNARVYRNPMPPAEAAGHVNSWLTRRIVRVLEPEADHVKRVLALLQRLGTAGNLVTDAQIAALAMENDAIVHTNDSDFLRFSGVKWLNPMTGMGSSGLGRGNGAH